MQTALFCSWMALLGLFLFARVDHPEIPAHGLYLSVVQIDHSKAEGEAQVLFKVFTDDLENVIRAAYGEKCRQGSTEDFIKNNRSPVESYFQTHFSCKINGAEAKLKLISGSLENEVYWLQFALQVPLQWEEITIKAPFFTEIYSSQSNIIHLLHGAEKRFARLFKGSDEVVFNF